MSSIPSRDRIHAAIEAAQASRPRSVCRTIKLKLHKPSRRKERALLWAQAHVTNMTAHILETLREEPGEVRNDRALACLHEMYARKAQGESGSRTQILADILSAGFRGGAKRRRKRPKIANIQRITSLAKSNKARRYRLKKRRHIHKSKPLEVQKLTSHDYPIAGPLRDGVFRQVALILINWHLRILGREEETEDGDSGSGSPGDESSPPDSVLDIAKVHTIWAERTSRYKQAAATLVPFGRHRGKPLSEVGKRDVRWLQERLISDGMAKEAIEHIEVLLNQSVSDEEAVHRARRAKHPWRRRSHLERSPRANRITQRSLDERQPLIRLEALSRDELYRLREELWEMQTFAEEFAAIREAVDLFLSSAPASYPTVHTIATGAQRQALVNSYEEALTELQERFPEQAEIETELVQTLTQRASDLGHDELQPLSFKRTMRPPGQRTSFALLYSTATPEQSALERKYGRMPRRKRAQKVAQVMNEGLLYTYVLAVVVHGAGAFKGEEPAERFTPDVRPGLFYVNYPETPFSAPRGSSVLLFPLEFGEKYQEQQFLRHVLEVQREAQHLKYQKSLRSKRPKPIATCLPEATISSARITSERTKEGLYDFYLHLPIKTKLLNSTEPLSNVIGIYEHSHGYSYAVLDFDGKVLDTGEVAIPDHVQPKATAATYSDNYVFETVKQIVCLAAPAGKPKALLGIRPMDWTKAGTSLSRDQNRLLFRRPSMKVATVLEYKALLAGLPRSRIVWGISPRECSRCSERRDYGSPTHRARASECPECGNTTLEVSGEGEFHCTACDAMWTEDELWFHCEQCGHRQRSRLNTAVVVARNLLTQVVERYEERRNAQKA